MRFLIFIADALILIAIFLTAAYLFASGYDKGRREANKTKKSNKKSDKRTRKGR